jgi:hypothetical protein
LIRLSGKTHEEAYLLLKDMREETYNGVGAWRIQLADEQIIPKALAKIKGLEQ